jgi:lipopolysaccharide export system permease protein
MKIFLAYILKRSFMLTMAVLFFFLLLDSVFSIISELEDVTEAYTFIEILKYILSSAPSRSIEFIEGACLLGFMLSLMFAQKEGNLNVLRSSGISPLKITTINALAPLLLSVIFLFLNEMYFLDLKNNAYIDKSNLKSNQTTTNEVVWYEDNNNFLSFEEKVNNILFNTTIINVDEIGLNYILKANQLSINEKNEVFISDSSKINYIYGSNLDTNFSIKLPSLIKISYKGIQNLTLVELVEYKNLERITANNKDDLFFSHISKNLYEKIFMPFSTLALCIFFGSFVYGSLRNSTSSYIIVTSVAGAFVYNLIQDFTMSYSISYNLLQIYGVLLPGFIIFIAGIVRLNKT